MPRSCHVGSGDSRRPVGRRLGTPRAVAAAIILIGTLWLNSSSNVLGSHTGVSSEYPNLHALQAASFLQGRIDLTERSDDVAVYADRVYSAFPPFPAVILVPFVALLGPGSIGPLLASILLAIFTSVVLVRLLTTIGVDPEVRRWIVVAFIFGTGYWMCVCWNWGVWYFAHIVAISCLVLALNEALGQGRGFIVGLCIGRGFLSRQLALYSSVFAFAALLHTHSHSSRRVRLREVTLLMLGLSACIGLYLAFNWMRFRHPLDTGYSYIVPGPVFQTRIDRFGSFSLAYVPFNFVYLFLQGFHLEFRPPSYIVPTGMDPWGTSLTFASPFAFLALGTRWTRGLLWGAWISIALTIMHLLLYNSNGMIQSNANRYALDFFPVLIILVALGSRRVPPAIWKGTIVYSVALNVVALFLVPLATKMETLLRVRV